MHNDYSPPLQRRTLVAGALAIVFALLPAFPARAADTFTLEGGGFGHSVGMSQFGAYGMARAGYSWEEIMSHYFTDATPGDVSPALGNEPIWVNLTMEQQVLSLTVRSIGAAPNSPVTFSSTAGSVTAGAGQTVTVTRLNGGNCRVDAPSGSFTGTCTIDAEWDGFADSPTAGVILDGCTLMNWNLTTGSRAQPCTYSRGGLRIRPDNNTNTVNLSVELDMEDYVLGISEMPYYWGNSGGMAALEAQAVAARSYAYSKVIARLAPEDRPWCWCSIYDTTVDQSYVGWGHGTQAWVDAVRNTEGKVMTHPSVKVGGQLTPIPTYYSSSTFGWTENSEDGFSSSAPYLRSVDDHWSQLPEVGNSHARWTRQFSGSQLASLLPGMNSVTGLAITKCSTTGAALEITFYGSGGPRAYKTRDLRGLLSLRSMQVITVSDGGAPTGCATPATASPPQTTTTTTLPPLPTTTTVPSLPTTTTVPEVTTTIGATTQPLPPTTSTTAPASSTTTTPPPDGTATACVTPPAVDNLIRQQVVLWAGASGRTVRELQAFLKAIGYAPGPIDGVYGSKTEKAVKKFQRSRDLPADGIVGSQTLSEVATIATAAQYAEFLRLEARVLRAGVSGSDVRQLQQLLKLIGYNPGSADGVFGPQTEKALKGFQKGSKLMIDGIVGSETRRAIAGTAGIESVTPCR
ncbi:MAG: peptidoglycan-binding protein [Acidimicrobiia bacterium]